MIGCWANINQGSAYIFERDRGGTNAWGQVKRLVASDGISSSDWFGCPVAISGNGVVVGAPQRSVGRGAAYLYKRDAGGLNMWGQVKQLLASDRSRSDLNGTSVAISGTTTVVGAFGDDIGTNVNQGSAYIFND